MGSALGLLRDRGALNGGVEWSGRNMDMKAQPHVVEARKALFSGAGDAQAQRIETALRRLDEFGRVLTPKEAFRELCHKFHGKGSSKNKQEKRLRQYAMELAAKKRLASANDAANLSRLAEVQQKLHTPYLVLEGNLKAGQVADPNSAYATRERIGGRTSPAKAKGTPAVAPGTASARTAPGVASVMGPPAKKPKNA